MATTIPELVETSDPPLATDSDEQFDAKAFPWAASLDPFGQSVSAIAIAARDNAEDALAAALGGDLPPLTGEALKFLRVKSDESGAEFAEVPEPVTQSTATWEAGTSTTEGIVSPAKVKAAVDALASGSSDYQQFDVSGTWTKPSGFSDDAFVLVEMWGAGGGDDGGGGAFSVWRGRLSGLGSSETVTVGAGGSSSGSDGGSTSVSGVPIPGPDGGRGDGGGSGSGGGGGEGMQPGGNARDIAPIGDAAAGSGFSSTNETFGRGGNGGEPQVSGQAPGGGGGFQADGADGRVIIWVWE